MSYLALYRKWRPLVFEEIISQEHISRTLKNSVKSGRISHAYLFTGTRGTGKTSTAHILSRAINCLDPDEGNPCNKCEMCRGILNGSILDVLEIDAASNNSIDNIREIRDEVIYLPSQAKYKVYIIDEVHMLSTGAFNALLKTLEEPPERVVFVLATTEPHKVPQTIISRCQRHDFRKIQIDMMIRHVSHVAAESGVDIEEGALRLIAGLAEGSMRDAINLLDQCISVKSTNPDSQTALTTALVPRISYDDVLILVGKVNEEIIRELVGHIIEGDVQNAVIILGSVIDEGKDVARFISDLITYYRNILLCISMGDKHGKDVNNSLTGSGTEGYESLKAQGAALGYQEVMLTLKELSSLESNLRWMPNPRIMLEVALIKLAGRLYSTESETLAEKITALERKLESLSLAGTRPEYTTIASEAASVTQNPSPHSPVLSDALAAVDRKPDTYNKGKQSAAPQKAKQPARQQTKQPFKPSSGIKELLIWGEVLHDLQNANKKMLHANLIETTAYELDANTVGVVFKKGSLSRIIAAKPENTAAIAETIQKKLGREIHVKCIDEGGIPVPVPTRTPAAPVMPTDSAAEQSGNGAERESGDEVVPSGNGDTGTADGTTTGTATGIATNPATGETDFLDVALKFAQRIGIPYNDDDN